MPILQEIKSRKYLDDLADKKIHLEVSAIAYRTYQKTNNKIFYEYAKYFRSLV